jgi:glutamine amidotransferase
VEYGVGNLRSVRRGIEKSGAKVLITNNPKDIKKSDAIVLPGVGAFTAAVKNLAPLSEVLKQSVEEEKPLLGICLGLQLLFTKSSEGGAMDGLDLIAGNVEKLSTEVKIPQIGWNTVEIVRFHPLLEGVPNHFYAYFVHSYIPKPSEQDVIVATTEYGVRFPSVIAKQHLFATQFHPEKSGKNGLRIITNFVSNVKR